MDAGRGESGTKLAVFFCAAVSWQFTANSERDIAYAAVQLAISFLSEAVHG